MNEVRLILEKGPQLSEQERLEIVNLGWLFAHAPAPDQVTAMRRISPLLGSRVDANSYMRAVREVAACLNRGIDGRLGRRVRGRKTFSRDL